MSLEEIEKGIKESMLSRDKIRLETLRNIKKELIELKTSKGHKELTETDIIKVIQKLVKQGKDSADIYKSQNRDDLYNNELNQVKIMEEYLPQQLTIDELKIKIKELISELNVTSIKEMGKVIGLANKRFGDRTTGKEISTMVKSLLN